MKRLLRVFGHKPGRGRGDIFGRALSPLVKAAPSSAPAEWLSTRLIAAGAATGTRVGSIVPTGYEAYARILHPAYGPEPDRNLISWTAAAHFAGCIVHAETQWESIEEAVDQQLRETPWSEGPVRGSCPPEVLKPLAENLSAHTGTPEIVWYGMWMGFPDVIAVAKKAPRFELPGREYALLTGPLSAAEDVITSPKGPRATQSLWWPSDRAWCVATEVDFRWTYVAASEPCIAGLVMDPRLEVLRTVPEHRGDMESDWPQASRPAP